LRRLFLVGVAPDSHNESVPAIPAHELTTTYDCKTPGCNGEARSRTGRHAYCQACRIARGTALPDSYRVELIERG
jgi:hypothetical protein